MAEEDTKQRLARAELAFRKGELLLKAGDVLQAESAFDEAVQHNPTSLENKAFLAYVRFVKPLGNRQTPAAAAEKALMELLAHKPKHAKAHVLLADICKYHNDLDRAEKELLAAQAADPSLAEAQRELAMLRRGPSMTPVSGMGAHSPTAERLPPTPPHLRKTLADRVADQMDEEEKREENGKAARAVAKRRNRWIALGVTALLITAAAVGLALTAGTKAEPPPFPVPPPRSLGVAGAAPPRPAPPPPAPAPAPANP